jgi:hypothetical protein
MLTAGEICESAQTRRGDFRISSAANRWWPPRKAMAKVKNCVVRNRGEKMFTTNKPG